MAQLRQWEVPAAAVALQLLPGQRVRPVRALPEVTLADMILMAVAAVALAKRATPMVLVMAATAWPLVLLVQVLPEPAEGPGTTAFRAMGAETRQISAVEAMAQTGQEALVLLFLSILPTEALLLDPA
jgi:hypothetical protein